jgi:hypothetical protein
MELVKDIRTSPGKVFNRLMLLPPNNLNLFARRDCFRLTSSVLRVMKTAIKVIVRVLSFRFPLKIPLLLLLRKPRVAPSFEYPRGRRIAALSHLCTPMSFEG